MADKVKVVEIDQVREKLIDLIGRARTAMWGKTISDIPAEDAFIADHLIANGVTVGNHLSQFLHPEDAYSGLKAKYLVFKGHTGEKVENCFVLRPDKDPAAVEALRAYATATENEALAQDVYNWVGQGELTQKWIPATERWPKEFVTVLVYAPEEQPLQTVHEAYLANGCFSSRLCIFDAKEVTHWMPLPEPPKGE